MNVLSLSQRVAKPLVFDLVAVILLYFIPAVAHLVSLPLYMIEPMRLILLLGIVHTSRRNAYFLAATLPLFSFIFSGHPELIKALIITLELLVNVMLYYLLAGKIRNGFFSMALAIICSKLLCYALYWAVFSWAFVVLESAPAFLAIQAATTLIFSLYPFFISELKSKRSYFNRS
jgi:hypothetical protein